MKKCRILLLATVLVLGVSVTAAQAATVINWWFAHGGRLGEKVQSMGASRTTSILA